MSRSFGLRRSDAGVAGEGVVCELNVIRHVLLPPFTLLVTLRVS